MTDSPLPDFRRFTLDQTTYKTMWSNPHNHIFEVSDSPGDAVHPPQQVFRAPYDFLFQFGGSDFVDDESEYYRWMTCFQTAGDTQFAIVENSDSNPRKGSVFNTDVPYESYTAAIEALHGPLSLMDKHYHVFGLSTNWGLYLAEYPTLLIVGCKPEYTEVFRNALNLDGNGFSDVESFVRAEFSLSKTGDPFRQFKQNYLVPSSK